MLVVENGAVKLKQSEKKLTPCDKIERGENLRRLGSNDTEFYGQITFKLIPGKLIPIPSSAFKDPQLAIYETDTDVPLSFHKDALGRFYVKLADEEKDEYSREKKDPFNIPEVTLGFVLKTKGFRVQNPLKKMHISEADRIVKGISFVEKNNKILLKLSRDIADLNEYDILQALLTVMYDPNDPDSKNPNDKVRFRKRNIKLTSQGAEILNDLLKYRTGRCEQCCHLVKALTDNLGIPCKIEGNTSHMFPCIKYKSGWLDSEEWFHVDVHGNPAKVTVEPMPNKFGKKQEKIERKETKLSLSDQDAKIEVKAAIVTKKSFTDFYSGFCTQLDEKSETKKTAIILCDSENQIWSLRGEMGKAEKTKGSDTCYLDNLDEISRFSFSAQDGRGKKTGSTLAQFLENQKQEYTKTGKATGTLIINCRLNEGIFNSYSALDLHRAIIRLKIPPGVKIVGMMLRKDYESADKALLSRFSIQCDEPLELEQDFVLKHCLSKAPGDQKECIPVELNQGDFSQTELIGNHAINERGLEFQYAPLGRLLKSKDPSLSFQTKPPGADPESRKLGLGAQSSILNPQSFSILDPDLRLAAPSGMMA